jgi:hypothetical protein
MEHEDDVLAVRPLSHFTFENLGQMSGRDVLNRIVFIDHDRHVVRETGSQ